MTAAERRDAPPPEPDDDASVVRSEEELDTRTEARPSGAVRAHKQVQSYPIDTLVERRSEQVDDVGERVGASEGDSGEVEVLEDGSVSIPVFEEELVVTKRLVVRERVILRKTTVVDEHRIQTELRRERVEIEADPGGEVDETTTSRQSDAGASPPADH